MTADPAAFDAEPRPPTDAPPDDPLAVGAELEALRSMRVVLADRIRLAPAYTLDRLTRELRQVVRAISELEADRPPDASAAATVDVHRLRERLVLSAVAAGANPAAVVDPIADAVPLPSGTPVHDELAHRHALGVAARDAAACPPPPRGNPHVQ